MARRNYIFETLRTVFQEAGYQQIETPAMEHLSTLTGKYGDEGDQLIFKILNSGDFISKIPTSDLSNKGSKALLPLLSERALKYDLTVPFARFVVMNQHLLNFPFKRYQIQPVWRADRPQKGRYREFYQCDADVIGSYSLINEAELIGIYDKAFFKLGIKNTTLRINNRKILAAIAKCIGKPLELTSLVVAIDKLDKIGIDGVSEELQQNGFTSQEIKLATVFWEIEGSTLEKLDQLKVLFKNSDLGLTGIKEIETILEYHLMSSSYGMKIELNLSLARGLNYYTGCIFEVISEHASGSIGGGGRYDDLTGIFGLKGMTGVGISFGADRIFDMMKLLDLFPKSSNAHTTLLVCNFYAPAQLKGYSLVQQIRTLGISAEFYPDITKLQKQLKYADQKAIPYVILIGEEEILKETLVLKQMDNGFQETINLEGLMQKLISIVSL